jgi:hypothetical protein
MNEIVKQEMIDQITVKMLDLPQAPCPVAHYFAPGVYVREVTFPAGIFAIGHKHKYANLNNFISGRVALLGDDGEVRELHPPMTFLAKPGQKMGVILEETVWQNIFPNPDDERNIDILEAKWLDKDGPWADHKKEDRQNDRDDFALMIKEFSLDQDQVKKQSEHNGDPAETTNPILSIRKSDIEGLGIYTSWPIKNGNIIGLMRFKGERTPLGKYTNHSRTPNSKPVLLDNGDIILIADRDISGCMGGDKGEEITIDYREIIRINPCLLQ